MKKAIFFFSLLFISLYSNAQVMMKLGSVTGNKGDNIAVELRVDNFTKLVSTQYAIAYDTLLMEYQSIDNFAPGYADISLLDPIASGKKGLIATTWNQPNDIATTFPSNSLLFKINFKLIGNPCDSGLIKVVDGRAGIEFIDENSKKVAYTVKDGKIKINGPNCQGGGGGGNDSTFTFVLNKVDVGKGSTGCVKLLAKNFNKLESFQGTLSWDKTIARFSSFNRLNLPAELINGLSADSTKLGFSWTPSSAPTFRTIADNTELFEICFDAVGAVNSVTNVSIINGPPTQIEVTGGGNGDVLPYKIENGSFKVVGASSMVGLSMRDTMGAINSEMCIPIYVNNFKCVETFQFAVKFDKTKMTFTKAGNIAVPNFSPATNIFLSNDSIKISWDTNGAQPVNLNDGSVLMTLCFNLNGPCNMTVPLSFINLSNNGPIDITGCNDPIVVKTTNANVTITCAAEPINIVYSNAKGVSCPGVCDGSVNATVTGGSGNFSYLWLRSDNSSTGITTKDATGLCAGNYKLQVTDITTSIIKVGLQVNIADASPIIITAVITHETNPPGTNGMIDVTVSGGTQPYKYKWVRLPNTQFPNDTTNKITGKRCGNYIVSVTDSKGCVNVDTFRINCPVSPLTSTINLADTLKCNGDCNASLKVDIQGGTIPYTYLWSTNETTISIKNLCAGTYTVTVTDAQTPASSTVSTYTITEPSKINIAVSDSTCANVNGQNGSNIVNVSGGTPSYTYEWRIAPAGSIVSTSKDLTNIAAGKYVLKVTDSKGCSSSYTATINTCIVQGNPPVVNLNVDLHGSTGVSCKGDCDGKITASVVGDSPFSYKWSHNANLNSNIADQLCAGNYTVTVTDRNSKSSTATVKITEPLALSISFKKIQCATTNIDTDGSYDAVVSGGTRPYKYVWCTNETTSTASSLGNGDCSITVTDANGCTKTETLTVCVGSPPNNECFKGRYVISPNGDNLNENFVISCSENYQNTLHIYTRWGKLVYSAVDYINQWTGNDQDGRALEEGTYMYVFIVKENGKNDVSYKGTVTIVR